MDQKCNHQAKPASNPGQIQGHLSSFLTEGQNLKSLSTPQYVICRSLTRSEL